jgi:two-component system sensor histidine kinase KdpD
MLDEGRRRLTRGEDVVVVAAQGAVDVEARRLIDDFEVIAPRTGPEGEAIDVDATLARRPAVALIDGLAYENPRGSRHAQRWQDVEELLDAGISVITTINLQYVQERQEQVAALRGKSTREAVPEAFLRTADEIEVVDAPPEYCLTRATAGTAADVAREERQLSELREMALLLAAEVVDYQLGDYLRRHGMAQVYGTHERILVCLTPRSNAGTMIRRGRRQADRFHGDLHVVYVEQKGLSAEDEAAVERHLTSARDARAHVEVLRDADPVRAIVRYAASQGITQIFAGHSHARGLLSKFRRSLVDRLIVEADGVDVRIFPRE